jgi:general secretion pathway protein J
MNNKQCHIHQNGFTLLELLISITLIAVILAIIFGAMRLGFRSIDKGEAKMESLERLRSSINIIESQIQSHIPLTFTEDGVIKSYFHADDNSLSFASNFSIWGGQKGYVIVSYTIEHDPIGKKSLYATENIVGTQHENKTKLFDNLDNIEFEFFGKDPLKDNAEWLREWGNNTAIPEKVRLHIVDGTRSFSLTIPLNAGKKA